MTITKELILNIVRLMSSKDDKNIKMAKTICKNNNIDIINEIPDFLNDYNKEQLFEMLKCLQSYYKNIKNDLGSKYYWQTQDNYTKKQIKILSEIDKINMTINLKLLNL